METETTLVEQQRRQKRRKSKKKKKTQSVESIFQWAIKELYKTAELFHRRKSQVILETALKLEDSGIVEKDRICDTISLRLDGFVDARWVRKVLDGYPQYKDQQKAKNANGRGTIKDFRGINSAKQAQTQIQQQQQQPQSQQQQSQQANPPPSLSSSSSPRRRQSQRQEQIEWRRTKIWELMSKGVYTSIFATYHSLLDISTIVAVVMILTGVLCAIATYLVNHTLLAATRFRHTADRALPFVLIALGVYILIEAFLLPSLHLWR
jgi:hypothetical protein